MRFVYGLLPDKIALMATLSSYAAEPLILELDWEEQKWFFATFPGYDLIDYQLSALIPVSGDILNYRRFQSELRLSMVLIFILCGYIGWKMAAGFVVPVKCFAETAEKLIEGDLSARMSEGWADEEFCQIARGFNQVAADVETGRILRKFVSDGALQTITASEKIDRKGSLQSRAAVVMFLRASGITDAFKENAAAQMVAELNRFFSAVCSSVRQNGGEVSKFIAEKAMVTFFIDSDAGAGTKVLAAVRSALTVLERLRRHKFLNGSVKIRVGIATGMVRSGIIGSETTRLEQAVIGDVVNLA
ncbi:MAG TPA: adenylate/guanylate cyclase domain-containing protein, partial [Candidatus Rifleibacterium sp.]|nr:adenylate/guanylate cyclase domain-containing protein [Candidatus Rifleibacterium sp.]